MPEGVDPSLRKTLVEAEGDVARHGVVIIRTIETDLVPAIMAAARDSLESAPRKLAKLSEEDLDDLMHSVRKAAAKSTRDLTRLYTRLLSKLATEDMLDLEKDLEGVDQLFKWGRIAESVESVNAILEEHGFPRLGLDGPADVADGLSLELDDKWQPAFLRFSDAVQRITQEIRSQETQQSSGRKRKKRE